MPAGWSVGRLSVHDPDMDAFSVDVADAALDDLRLRLERTRFATPTPGPPGQAGIPPQYLRELVDYWLRRFDWRQVEARINAFPQFTADVGGVRMHFVYRRSPRPGAPTVVVLHGWPYTFVEMLPARRCAAGGGRGGAVTPGIRLFHDPARLRRDQPGDR
jgi:hypothetical protein